MEKTLVIRKEDRDYIVVLDKVAFIEIPTGPASLIATVGRRMATMTFVGGTSFTLPVEEAIKVADALTTQE